MLQIMRNLKELEKKNCSVCAKEFKLIEKKKKKTLLKGKYEGAM